MRMLFHKLRSLLQRRRKEEELREELQFHLEEEAEECEAKGLSGEEARAAARRDFGNVTQMQEETRSVWTWTWLEQLGQDCRYGLRTMAGNKTFSLLAVLSLALGIGANTAIYSFMDWLLLRSLPVADPGSLVVFNWRAAAGSGRESVVRGVSGSIWRDGEAWRRSGNFPYPAIEVLRKHGSDVFSSLFTHFPTRRLNVLVKGSAGMARGVWVSGGYFAGLGVVPMAGRLIAPDDDRAGAAPVVVLSHSFSQKRFGDAVSGAGQSILMNNRPFTVVGVTPPDFQGVDPEFTPDFYVPLLSSQQGDRLEERFVDANYYWVEAMGRLRPGVSMEQAQAALGPVFHRWVEATARNDNERSKLPELSLREGKTGIDTMRRQYSRPVYLLLAVAMLILVVACANIANLLLARATARRREMAVRLSIGAGRWRVIRQLLTESVLLSVAGGVLGLALAVWGMQFLTLLMANGSEDFTVRPSLNWRVLGMAFGLALLTGVLFGLMPAVQATRVDVLPALKETRAGQPRSRRWRGVSLSHALVAAQIGICVLMLVGAGLFVRTLRNLQSIQLGFNRENVLLFRMNAKQAGHEGAEIVSFYRNLLTRFGTIPGVSRASAMHHPLLGEGTWSSNVVPLGQEPKPGVFTHVLMVGPDFFSTMQIAVMMGRTMEERDHGGARKVAVVSESYARRYFGDRSPIGERITIRMRPPLQHEVEIIGVAANARYGALKGEFRDIAYVPFEQGSYYPVEEMVFALRTGGDPLRHVQTVRDIVRQADPHVPVTDVKTQAAQMDQMVNQEAIFAQLCTVFAALGLVIACVGLYGTMAYAVERRTGEIGIRMALGAERGDVLRMILREALLLTGAGVGIGLPVALGTSRLVESFLYGVKPNSWETLVLACGVLLGAMLVAGYVPARRAARIDPMVAVRHE